MIPRGLVLKSSNFSKYSLSHSITSIKTQSEHDGTATSVAMKGHRVSFELSRKKPAVIYLLIGLGSHLPPAFSGLMTRKWSLISGLISHSQSRGPSDLLPLRGR